MFYYVCMKSDESLSKEERSKTGAYFTDNDLISLCVDPLLNSIDKADLGKVKVLDPACGNGNFLKYCKNKGIREDNLYGIELNPLFANECRQNLPNAHIVCENALTFDWHSLFKPDKFTLVIGNPPYLGSWKLSKSQKQDLKNLKLKGQVDYAGGFFIKASEFLNNSGGRFSFITTNSIFQGSNILPIFKPIFSNGWSILSAKRNLKWKNKGASVHVSIALFAQTFKPSLYSPYDLALLPTVFIDPLHKPLNKDLPLIKQGLTISKDKIKFTGDGNMKYIGAREVIHNGYRKCAYEGNKAPNNAYMAIPRHFSYNYPYSPLCFYDRSFIPSDGTYYLTICSQFSSNYPYSPLCYFDNSYLPSKSLYYGFDYTGLAFSVISTQMFMAWQKLAGGYLKSDYRFGSSLVYNTFPLPKLTDTQKQELINAGRKILEIRKNKYPNQSLADLYKSNLSDLNKAYKELDQIMDSIYREKEFKSTIDRQKTLLEMYEKMTNCHRLI